MKVWAKVWEGLGRFWKAEMGAGSPDAPGDLGRAYLQGGSQESLGEGGERLRNGVGRDFLQKNPSRIAFQKVSTQNQQEHEKCCRFTWSNPKKNKIAPKSKFCTDFFDPQCIQTQIFCWRWSLSCGAASHFGWERCADVFLTLLSPLP